jgi:hypothetical protein
VKSLVPNRLMETATLRPGIRPKNLPEYGITRRSGQAPPGPAAAA